MGKELGQLRELCTAVETSKDQLADMKNIVVFMEFLQHVRAKSATGKGAAEEEKISSIGVVVHVLDEIVF